MAYRTDVLDASNRPGNTRKRRFSIWRRTRPFLEQLECRLTPSVGGGWISSTQFGQSGDGFLGQYYGNPNLKGTPAFTGWDDRIEFLWPRRLAFRRARQLVGSMDRHSDRQL